MSRVQYVTQTPGKLMIGGEYAVLEPAQPAIVMAINRYVTVSAARNASVENTLSLPTFQSTVTWSYDAGEVCFSPAHASLKTVGEAISVALHYIGDPLPPLAIHIESQLDNGSGTKYGLGSSAAVVVGTIAALLEFARSEQGFQFADSRELLFKLSALAHFRAQGGGSGADIAAAVYGGVIKYTAFSPSWLYQQYQHLHHEPLRQIVTSSWPLLSICPLPYPSDLHLCIGWTKKPASTPVLIGAVKAFQQEHEVSFRKFVAKSRLAVDMMTRGFISHESALVFGGLTTNREALAELGQGSGIEIETRELRDLSDIVERFGGAAKLSGAGGGDCGIGFVTEAAATEMVQRKWLQSGIQPLHIKLDTGGVTIHQVSE